MIILISGQMGSGKTTLANALEEDLPNNKVVQTIFAKAIYEMHDECRFILQSYSIPVKGTKDGELLQYLGTEYGRNNYGKDVWCKTTKAFTDSVEREDKDAIIIISDCRFQNELHYFPEAFKIRLSCDRDTRKSRAKSWRSNETHPSEIDLDGMEDEFDLVLDTGKLSVKECVRKVIQKLEELGHVKK